MSLSFREEQMLSMMEGDLRRSDPALAAQLAAFGVLTTGALMPAREHPRTPVSWLCLWLARAVALISLLAARAGRACNAGLLGSGEAWAAALGFPAHADDSGPARGTGDCPGESRNACLGGETPHDAPCPGRHQRHWRAAVPHLTSWRVHRSQHDTGSA